MTGLKYGKLYIDEGSIRSAMGLTADTHLEFCERQDDGAFEFTVVASSENKHEWLVDKPEHGTGHIRRVRVPIESKGEDLPTIEEMRHAKEYADALNAITGRFGMGVDEAIGFVKDIAKIRK